MNSKSIGDNGPDKTALMRFRIEKLQVVEEFSDNDESNDENNDELEQKSNGCKEIIIMLDKIRRSPVFDDDCQDTLLV